MAENANPDGLYQGTFIENGVSFDVIGLVANEELFLFSESASVFIEGAVSVTGKQMTVAAKSWDLGGLITSATFTGVVTEGVSLTGTYSDADGDSGTYSLAFDPIYNRGASLATVTGNWSDATWAALHGFDTATMSVLGDSFTASDTGGCLYAGSLTPGSSGVNLYQTAMTISSCGQFNGNYTGYGTTKDGAATDDTLFFVASSPADFFYLSILLRQ